MNIALAILHNDPARGGAERYTVDLAAALSRRGHRADVLSSETLGVVGWMRVTRYSNFLTRLNDHLAKEKYDVVHAMLPVRRCDVYHPHAGMAAEAMSRLSSHFNPRRRAMAAVEANLLAGEWPSVVLSLSDYSKRDILHHYDIEPEKLITLFNAVDLDRFTPGPARREDGKIVALMIANDFARKGLLEAIRALSAVGDDRLLLRVAGKQDPAPYRREASRQRARVEFLGSVADPRPLYEGADFFVLPTKHDPCSLVVLEALAMGLPVISTKFNGAVEIMTDGVHGYVLDEPHDVPALAEAMRKMLDPERRAQMSRTCLDLRPELSYERHLDTLLEIYRQVAAG